MNKNQMKGTAKNITGKAQQQMGKLSGNKKQQIKGLEKQVSGTLQKSLGDATEVIEDIGKSRP
ncbi:MAG: CsbD family protein [Burkholderiales bacterium]